MDLDALSGVIAYKHTGDAVTTVTAACDRITINHPLTEICDLELSGQVTYASGRSSMEITIQVAKAPAEGQRAPPSDVLLTCTFTMVSLDPGTRKPVNIPAVVPSTPEEQRLYERGEAASRERKAQAQTALLKHTPNDEESDLIHALWQQQLRYDDPNDAAAQRPATLVAMADTRVSTAAIMQPQFRNRHHFMIFGGFLLKQTFELAFCCAAAAAHTRPTFVSLDPSVFMNPVPVGSVLYLTATVVYTDPPLVAGASEEEAAAATADEDAAQGTSGGNRFTRVQVRVDSKVRDVEHGSTKPTGQFNYTFTVDRALQVMPRTYSEFMMYVDARRRVARVQERIRDGEEGTGRKVDAGEAERVFE
jgi:acyl-coenzyme A thioesterase 9